jgi:hypothetical protein
MVVQPFLLSACFALQQQLLAVSLSGTEAGHLPHVGIPSLTQASQVVLYPRQLDKQIDKEGDE